MDKKVLKFDLAPSQVKIKDLLNKQFLDVSIDAISDVYPNRNNSHFTLEALNNAIPTVFNKPVLGAFGKGAVNGANDFDEHNADIGYDQELNQAYWDYENGERILGTVRESDYVGVEHKNGNDWLTFRCCLWTLYNYKAVKSLLKSRKKKVSVEIEVLDGYIDENGVEIITKFTLLGVTILGDKTMEGIPGANLTILEKLENALFRKDVECLQFAYKSLDEEALNNQENVSNNEVSNLENNSNLHNNVNDYIERGGDAMLTVEQKRILLQSEIDKFVHSDEFTSEGEKWAYVCDMTDSEVVVRYSFGYMRYKYELSEEEKEISIDFVNGEKVLPSWKDFVNNDEDGQEDDEDEKDDNEPDNNPEDDNDDDDDDDNDDEQEDMSSKSDTENVANSEDDSVNQDNENTETVVENDVENNFNAKTEVPVTIEIDGETYDINQLYEKYKALNNEYNLKIQEIETLNAKVFSYVCNELISYGNSIFDSEEEFTEDDKDEVVKMKAKMKEKCENKEFDSSEKVANYVEDVIAKYLYQKRKEMRKNNIDNEKTNSFSVNILTNISNKNTKRNSNDILKDYIDK